VTASGQNEHTDLPTATVVIETTEFTGDLEYLVDHAGFLLQRVMPADDPTTADLSGHGVRLRLRRGSHDLPARLVVPRVGLRHEGDEGGDDHGDGPLVSPGGRRSTSSDRPPNSRSRQADPSSSSPMPPTEAPG
jgi:hypothetical protein